MGQKIKSDSFARVALIAILAGALSSQAWARPPAKKSRIVAVKKIVKNSHASLQAKKSPITSRNKARLPAATSLKAPPAAAPVSAQPLQTETFGAKSIFELAQPCMFQVKTSISADAPKATYGSGFVISKDGLVATNFHVIRDALHEKNLSIYLVDPRTSVSMPAKVVGFDVINDLAVLKTEKSFEAFLAIRDTVPVVGERTFSVGLPKDLTMAIIEGTENGVKGEGLYQHIVLSTPLNSGMSGGPTLDDRGQVVGVNVAIQRDSQSLSFAVPADRLKKLMTRLQPFENARGEISQQVHAAQAQLTEQILSNEAEPARFAHWNFSLNRKNLNCWRNEEKGETLGALLDVMSCNLPFSAQIDESITSAYYSVRAYEIKSDTANEPLSYSARNVLLPKLTGMKIQSGQSRNYKSRACNHRIVVNQQGVALRVNYCITSLRNYPGLFDMNFEAITVADLNHNTLALQGKFHGFADESLKKIAAGLLDRIEGHKP